MLTADKSSYQEEETLQEEDKLKEKWLRNELDATISAIGRKDRTRLTRAYNLRNGVREMEEFEYLWKSYGIEFPSKLRHVPVLRAVFDSLVGKYINQPFKWQVSSSDSETVNFIFQEYRDAIMRDVENYYVSRVRAAQIMGDMYPGSEGDKARLHLEELKKKYEGGKFQSEVEIDAKNVMSWAINRFDLKGKIYTFVNDLVSTGEGYYQSKVLNIGEAPLIRTLNPKTVYVNKPTDVKFVKHCERIAIKESMSVADIWTKYGHQMKREDAQKFLSKNYGYIVNSDVEIIHYELGELYGAAETENWSKKDLGTMPCEDVYYCEWKSPVRVEVKELPEGHLEGEFQDALDNLKVKYKYRMDLFEGTRIGPEIYVGLGRNKHAVRNPDDKANVDLTINGIFYNDRNGEPYALPLKLKDIADMIDIIYYHAETYLALSGVKAVNVDFADIPSWLGEGLSPMERVQRYLGIVKQGLVLSDRSAEGANKNQQGGSSIDLSLGSGVQYLYDMADRLEAAAYKIAGTSRQSLGNITQSDGKGTTELAIQGSETVLKPFFYTCDELAEAFMTDVVNCLRIAYKEGITGTILMDEVGQRVFATKSKQFPLAFINVWINNDGEIERDLEAIRGVAQSLIEAQLLDPVLAVDLVTVKSLTEIKKKVREATENNSAQKQQQTEEQLAQYEEQLKKLQAQAGKADEAKAQNDAMKLQEDAKKNAAELELKAKDLQFRMTDAGRKNDIEERRVNLEQLQLAYPSSKSSEIKNSK